MKDPLRICLIGKYPPIEGGVSMQNYWLCRTMAERGHKVFVITNANEVEDSFRIYLEVNDHKWIEPKFRLGFVKVKYTDPPNKRYIHIPFGNPFITKLTSLALETIRKHKCNVIDASYLEPYSIVAYLASKWTGTPYIVRPAGSDIKRLIKIDQLRPTYTEVLKNAHLIVSKPRIQKILINLGINQGKIYPMFSFWLPKKFFNNHIDPLDINQFFSLLSINNEDYVKNILKWSVDPIDLSLPTIGHYGKVGTIKGSIDLVKALGHLKQKGLKFNFLCLSHGFIKEEDTFRRKIKEVGIESETRILPFLPHWRIPSFIRSCLAICYLERGFPILSHRSPIPMEVLLCGVCLVLSKEVVQKQAFRDELLSNKNCLIIENPENIEELERNLERVILNPKLARLIGVNGGLVVKNFKDINKTTFNYEKLLKIVVSNCT
ncbi:MAG: glycosyltransferase [Promethearchaeota archaeon]